MRHMSAPAISNDVTVIEDRIDNSWCNIAFIANWNKSFYMRNSIQRTIWYLLEFYAVMSMERHGLVEDSNIVCASVILNYDIHDDLKKKNPEPTNRWRWISVGFFNRRLLKICSNRRSEHEFLCKGQLISGAQTRSIIFNMCYKLNSPSLHCYS